MIEHANSLINEWVEWRLKRHSTGLGYPSSAAFMRFTARSTDNMGFSPIIDERAMQTDRALALVRTQHPRLWQVVEEYYIVNQTVQQAAKACGCGKSYLYDRLIPELHSTFMAYFVGSAKNIAVAA